ncbi:epidermal growth factor-like protein 7 isoform X4 [Lepus europaeus]|uniref:epidermal growth factor-like protein 7 isoform X4 n=1 Tax=Lepus europaeus TaxID=9983 RepID=UPI002B497CED|nr:epidermal growth factor-like protein 7 isoform X4 [Lepus europaeus]
MAKPRPRQHQVPALPGRAAAASVGGMTSRPLAGPCTGLPTAAAPGQPPPGLAMPAAPAGREAVGSPGPVQQPYASRHVGMEGAVSGPAAAAALRDGGVTPVRQTWMSAALAGPAAPSAVSTPPGATGASAGRGTAPLRTGGSACPGEGPPARPQARRQKLQLALAPLHSLASLASEHGLPDPGSLLVHSLRQLDRVDSLSEQISFLEEQLGSCSCRKEL